MKTANLWSLITILSSGRIVLLAALISAILAGSLLYLSVNLASSLLYVGIIGLMSFGLTGLMCTNDNSALSAEARSKPACPSCGFVEEKAARYCSNCGVVLQNRSDKRQRFAFSYTDILVSVAFFVSVAVVLTVPSMGTLLIWTDWVSIPAGNYVRIAAAILLTTFLPGYFLLAILDLGRRLKAVEVLLLSYLLSLFIVPTWSMLASAAQLTLDRSGVNVVIVLNTVVLISFVVGRVLVGFPERTWLKIASKESLRNYSSRRNFYALICTLAGFAFVLAMSYRLSGVPPTIWETDEWFNHGTARLYEKFGNLLFTTRLQPINIDYPRWFHIYLGTLFAISGAPTTNTYSLISFANIFGLLGLYMFASSFSERSGRTVAPVAAVLALFSGLGWAYDLWSKSQNLSVSTMARLYQSSISSYDILFANTFFGSSAPQLTTALQVMGLPALLALLWLVNRDDLRGWLQYILIMILTSLASLGHVIDGGIFAAIILFGAFISEKITWRVSLAAVIGVVLTGALGAIMPDRYYVTLGAYYLTLAIAGFAVLVSLVKQRYVKAFVPEINSRIRLRLAIAITVGGLAVWIALFLLWRLSGYNSFNIWWDCPRCATTVPIYLYPDRFGILGLLGIPAAAFILVIWKKETHGAALVCGLAIVGLILGRLWMVPQLYRFTGLEEFRYNKYVALALTIPVALMLCKWLGHNARKRTTQRILLGGVLVAVILFSGLASTVLYSEFTGLAYTTSLTWRPDRTNTEFSAVLSHQLTPEEMAGIQFIVYNLKTGETVGIIGGLYWAAAGFTYMKLTFLGGLLKNQTFSLNDLYGLENTTIYQRLAAAKTRFIYLSLDDQEILKQHAQLYKAITTLKVAFLNDQVIIYSLNM